MKKFIFILLIVTLSTGVYASGFSPSSLTFSLREGESECQVVSITSNSETIYVSDEWAESAENEWTVSGFQTSASEHEISIDYDEELSVEERTVEVCLSGKKEGEYHGVLVLREEQSGSSVIQMGVWLKIFISAEAENSAENSPSSSSSSGSSGGGGALGSSGSQSSESEFSENSDLKETLVSEEENEEKNSAGITGAVVGGSRSLQIISFTLIFLAVSGFIVFYRRRNKL